MSSLTILNVTNKMNAKKGSALLESQSRMIPFLRPKLVLIDDCESYSEYNRRNIEDMSGWFDTDFVLKVEFDSCIVNPFAWSDDFFNYDYIGAPWIGFFMKW